MVSIARQDCRAAHCRAIDLLVLLVRLHECRDLIESNLRDEDGADPVVTNCRGKANLVAAILRFEATDGDFAAHDSHSEVAAVPSREPVHPEKRTLPATLSVHAGFSEARIP